MNVKLYLLIITGFILFNFINLYAGFSTNKVLPEPGWGVNQCSLAWGDFDNDGNLDLAVTGDYGGGLSFRIYKNNKNGSFDINAIEPDIGWGVSKPSLAWCDYDKDGDLDIAVSGWDGGARRFRIYRNNGNGTINSTEIEPHPFWGADDCSLTWVDFDNDNDMDIAIAGYDGTGYRLRIYINNGSGNLSGFITPDTNWGVNQCSMSWADFDKDGDMDLAVAGWDGTTRQFRIYKNNGKKGFEGYITPQSNWGVSQCSLAWGDYDKDGYPDLAIAGHDGTGYIFRIYKNNRNGGFSGYITPEPGWGVNQCSLAWGDYNNDGNLDIAITGYDGNYRFRIYKNNGNGSFDPVEIEPQPGWGAGQSSLAWGDFDNDGDYDIAIAGWDGTSRQFRVYTNLQISGGVYSNNNPPSVPSGLTAIEVEGCWRFQWNASYDDHTPVNLLRYYIAIKTNKSGNYNYIPDYGGVPPCPDNLGNLSIINGPLCYYQSKIPAYKKLWWKVCAIDSGFKVSGYSPETLPPPWPFGYENIIRGYGTVNGPNPFNPDTDKTTIAWNSPLNSDTDLAIFALNGEFIIKWHFSNGKECGKKGINSFKWDGKNEVKQIVASGVYPYSVLIRKTGQILRGKILVIR